MSIRIYLQRSALCLTTICAAATQASAHEKWFHETAGYGLRWDLFFRPLPLAFVAAVLLATLTGWFIWKRRGRGFVPGPESFGTTDDRRALRFSSRDSRRACRRAASGQRRHRQTLFTE